MMDELQETPSSSSRKGNGDYETMGGGGGGGGDLRSALMFFWELG